MAITVQTIHPNQLYQLRVTNTSSDIVILSYTYATGLLSSNYLPSTAVALLQRRWDSLVSGLSPSVVNNFVGLLASLVHISDSGAELGIYYTGDGNTNWLYATDLILSNTYSINVGIPNSHEMWLTGGKAAAAPF